MPPRRSRRTVGTISSHQQRLIDRRFRGISPGLRRSARIAQQSSYVIEDSINGRMTEVARRASTSVRTLGAREVAASDSRGARRGRSSRSRVRQRPGRRLQTQHPQSPVPESSQLHAALDSTIHVEVPSTIHAAVSFGCEVEVSRGFDEALEDGNLLVSVSLFRQSTSVGVPDVVEANDILRGQTVSSVEGGESRSAVFGDIAIAEPGVYQLRVSLIKVAALAFPSSPGQQGGAHVVANAQRDIVVLPNN